MEDDLTTDSEVLAKLVQWHESAEQSTADSRAERERERDYVDNKQWSPDEVAKLERRKQPVVTINRIGPKVNFLLGTEQQHRSDPKAFPRTPDDEEGANAATDAIRYVMDLSRWDRLRSECFNNFIVEGACGVDVQVYEKSDGYCIELKKIDWARMWGDPHSKDRGWNDGKYKGQFIWMDLDDALEKWPTKRQSLETTMSTVGEGDTYDDVPRVRWADPKRKRVRIAECWTKEEGSIFHNVYTKGGILERMESPFKNEDDEPDDGFVFGSCNIDRDGNRYGVVTAWMSIQDEINKRRSKAMHLLSVRQVKAERGAVEDVNKARQELAKPDGYIEVTPGMMFEELANGEMAAAQFQLLQEAKSEIDAVGVNAALSGNEGRVMSGRALIQKSEQGLAELGPVFDAFKQFQLDVYAKVWSRIKQFWTAEKWIRITDDEKNLRFIGLNQPMTLGEQLIEEARKQGMQITPEMEQQAKMDPAMQRVVGVKNNVAQMNVDITMDDVPQSASIQAEQFETLAQIAPQAGAMPPPLFEALIEASGLRNKQKILKKLRGEDQEVPPAVAQMQQQMQEMQQALQQAQQEANKAKQEAATAKMQAQGAMLDGKAKDLQLQEQQATARIKDMIAAGQPQPEAPGVPPELQSLAAEIDDGLKEIKHAHDLLKKDETIALLRIEAKATTVQQAEQQIEADASGAEPGEPMVEEPEAPAEENVEFDYDGSGALVGARLGGKTFRIVRNAPQQ